MSDSKLISVESSGNNIVFLPFWKKVNIYQEFFAINNIWDKYKKEYWQHEKFLLKIACSEKHQHLWTDITSKIVHNIYEKYADEKLNASFGKLNGMFKDQDFIKQLLGNLVVKGLAEVKFLDRELIDKGSKNIENIDENFLYIPSSIYSINFNRIGFEVGRLVIESERFNLLFHFFYQGIITLAWSLGVLLLLYFIYHSMEITITQGIAEKYFMFNPLFNSYWLMLSIVIFFIMFSIQVIVPLFCKLLMSPSLKIFSSK